VPSAVELPLSPLEGEELDQAMILALHAWGDQRTPAEEERYRELIAKNGPESDPDFTINDYVAQLGRLAQLEPGDALNLDDPDLAGERIDVFVPELNAWVAVECDGYSFTVEGPPEADEEETDDDMVAWVEDAFRTMYRRPSRPSKPGALLLT
jgi:hypothetical protein